MQSESSKVLEQIGEIVGGDDPVERLRELWSNVGDRQKRIIQDKLRFLARQEDEKSGGRNPERVTAADFFQDDLASKSDDPFRAVAKSLW